jgi:hypothetical protein
VFDLLRGNPDVELVRDGNYTWDGTGDPGGDVPAFRLREGRSLDPDNIRLTMAGAFRHSYPQFRVLRERFGRPDISFQVGLISPLDIGTYFVGSNADAEPEVQEAFTRATLREIDAIRQAAPDPGDVVFQIETVVAQVATNNTPEAARAGVADAMAAKAVEVAARAPEGTRFGVHLCFGDFHHKAFTEMRDASAQATLANAVSRAWPSGRPLEFIHFPLCAAAVPPPLDEAAYAPLADLDLPATTRVATGFIHESLDIDTHRKLLATIERQAGQAVDPSAACGLGRRPDDAQAWDAMDKTSALLEAG